MRASVAKAGPRLHLSPRLFDAVVRKEVLAAASSGPGGDTRAFPLVTKAHGCEFDLYTPLQPGAVVSARAYSVITAYVHRSVFPSCGILLCIGTY